jgi:hypothetical protein
VTGSSWSTGRRCGDWRRARDRDISQAPLLLQAARAALVERALRREQAFLPADEEHGIVFQPLGGVDRHDRDLRVLARRLVVHDEADVFEERA